MGSGPLLPGWPAQLMVDSHLPPSSPHIYTMGVVIHKADSKLPRTDADSDLLRSVEVTRVLELYPEYYKLFQEASHCLMAGDGSLPRQSRHYVAFVVSVCVSREKETLKPLHVPTRQENEQ